MVLTVVPMNIIVFWDVMPATLVEIVLRFGRICYLYLHYPPSTSTTTTTTTTHSLFTYQTKKFTVHTTDTLFFLAAQLSSVLRLFSLLISNCELGSNVDTCYHKL